MGGHSALLELPWTSKDGPGSIVSSAFFAQVGIAIIVRLFNPSLDHIITTTGKMLNKWKQGPEDSPHLGTIWSKVDPAPFTYFVEYQQKIIQLSMQIT